jgi:D-tagatose-1,6-bisphosphate aldolase subunit GatZ/KbaZ
LIRHYFAILKVGPALTFAFREAAFALAMIEEELLGHKSGVVLSRLRITLEDTMRTFPQHWDQYYAGSLSEQRLSRCYSFSDRVRYYWANPNVQSAPRILLRNLGEGSIPLALLSQFLAKVHDRVRSNEIANNPSAIILAKIAAVLDSYSPT